MANRYFDKQGNFLKTTEIKSLFYNEWDSFPEHIKKMYEDAKYLYNLYPTI